MTVKYFSVLTDKGAARLARAVASGSKISITTMKLGMVAAACRNRLLPWKTW